MRAAHGHQRDLRRVAGVYSRISLPETKDHGREIGACIRVTMAAD
jgi:hypothetical protein